MAAKMGSFKYSFQEKRERLLSTNKRYSELGYVPIEEQDPSSASSPSCCTFRSVSDRIVGWCRTIQDVSGRAIHMGQSDPRKIVFSAKMGLALMLISLLIFLKEPFKQLGRYSVWAILTVVVVFEFSIGIVSIPPTPVFFGSIRSVFGSVRVISSYGDFVNLHVCFSFWASRVLCILVFILAKVESFLLLCHKN